MASERDYASERERRKNQSEFQFQGGTQGLVRNAPRSPSNKPRIPVDKNHYVPGRATQEARQLAAAHSRPQNGDREQLPPQYELEETQQVAFVQAIPVVVIGGLVLVAVGATLFLQVEDENGELTTVNEYASRPVADLMETITNDVSNYYQTEAKDKISEIRTGVSQALNKIVVRQEPEPQVYTSPNGEQGTIEHTGHAPPEVETGTPGIDTGQQVEAERHTGHAPPEQKTAEDFVMESQVNQDFNNSEVRRRDNIAHGGYYTRKNIRKLVQEGTVSNHGGKHLKARTEEQARQLSHKQAQYLPGINNGALEKEALLNGEHLLRREGGGFWNFYRSNDYVGYDQGIKTRWIRAEYISGTIHGHPINPKRLSKYVKNPTP